MKIEETLEYFKNEWDLINEEYQKNVESRRFSFNIQILIFSAFVVLFSASIQTFFKLEYILAIPDIIIYFKIILIMLGIGLIYPIFHYITTDWRDYRKTQTKKIHLRLIIKFLLYAKVMKISDEILEPLYNRIRHDFQDLLKDDVKRLDEYIHILDKINGDYIRHNKKIK